MTTPYALIADAMPETTWTLDPDRSTLTFDTKTLWGAYTIKGAFTELTGVGQVTPGHDVAGWLVARTASLSTAFGKCDEHLRSAKFFDVEHHPEITVEVHGVDAVCADHLGLDTTITVKGVAHPMVLHATVRMLDDGAVRIATNATIMRGEFGVDGNMLGMIPETTRIGGVIVFLPRATPSSQSAWAPSSSRFG